MTEKRFKLRLSKLGNGMITDTKKKEDLYFDKEFLEAILPKATEWLNELAEENEQLKKKLYDIAIDYYTETYYENSVRRDEHIKDFKEEFKTKYGDEE